MSIKILEGLGVVIDAIPGVYRRQIKCSKRASLLRWVLSSYFNRGMPQFCICSVIDITLIFWQLVSGKWTISPPFVPWKMGTADLDMFLKGHREGSWTPCCGRVVPRTSLHGREHMIFHLATLLSSILYGWPPRIIEHCYNLSGWFDIFMNHYDLIACLVKISVCKVKTIFPWL